MTSRYVTSITFIAYVLNFNDFFFEQSKSTGKGKGKEKAAINDIGTSSGVNLGVNCDVNYGNITVNNSNNVISTGKSRVSDPSCIKYFELILKSSQLLMEIKH